MANIAITSQCNLNCRYCFAQNESSSGVNFVRHMSLAVYQQSLEFVEQSDIKQIRILGGEPTLHPDLIPYLELALQTDQPLRLFSNGFMSNKALDFLSSLPDENIHIILNITNLAEQSIQDLPRLEKTLNRLHSKIILGFNIYKKDIQFDFLLDLIRSFNLKKTVRLGLAHPCIGFKNQYLLPKHYFHVGQKIIDFAREAQKQSVKINLDCGFVPCMFGNEVWRQLGLDADLGLHCEPIPDILPDGSIVPCYPLASPSSSRLYLSSASSVGSVREQFTQLIPEYSNSGIFKFCSVCDYKKNGFCTGGCTAHKILRSNAIERITFKISQNEYEIRKNMDCSLH